MKEFVDSEDSYRHSKWLSFMSRRLKIAKKYWRGAKIEQFDALSPEYSIKIEKK